MGVVISSWLRLTRGRGDAEKFSAYHQRVLTAPADNGLTLPQTRRKAKLEIDQEFTKSA